jgi:DNA-binding NarL/FixJ family response regulator
MGRTGTVEGEERIHGMAGLAHRRFRLVLAEDHQDVREEVRQLLDSEFEVLRAVGEGAALMDAAAELRPDAIVTDVRMPRMGGIEAGELLLRRGVSEAVVVFSMYADAHLVKAALDAGIRAYILKVDAAEELIPAIYAALRGERYLSQGVREQYRG